MQSGQMKITYLDSTTVNVYQNCQMVFLLIDPRVVYIYINFYKIVIIYWIFEENGERYSKRNKCISFIKF